MKTRSFFKQISCVILVLSLSFSFIQCGGKDKIVEKALQMTSEQLNKQCPMMIDAITRLDNTAVFPGKVLMYNYTIIDTSNFNEDQMKEVGIPFIKNTVKTNPQMEELRKLEVTFKYQYKDNEGKVILSFDVTPNDYK